MRKLAPFALALALVCSPAIQAQTDLKRVSPEDFLVDAYDNVPYAERPLASESVLPEDRTESSYLDQMEPFLGEVMVNEVESLDLDPESMARRKLDLMELNLMNYIEEEIPEIADLRHENENHEFEVNHFLKLRRAELKELHLKIDSQREKKERLLSARMADIEEVKAGIRSYYEEIDLHLEDPSSSYDDDYIVHRKRMIRKMMKKEMALERDYREQDYPDVLRADKALRFLEQRRDEILVQSRDLSFPFVKRKMSYVEKNNARINYLVSRLSEEKLKMVRSMLSSMRSIRTQLDGLMASSSKSEARRSLEEDVRFEEKYYSELKKKDEDAMNEARRLRGMQEKLTSKSSVVTSRDGRGDSGDSVSMSNGGPPQYIYLLPVDQMSRLPKIREELAGGMKSAPAREEPQAPAQMAAPLPGMNSRAPSEAVLPPTPVKPLEKPAMELPPLMEEVPAMQPVKKPVEDSGNAKASGSEEEPDAISLPLEDADDFMLGLDEGS